MAAAADRPPKRRSATSSSKPPRSHSPSDRTMRTRDLHLRAAAALRSRPPPLTYGALLLLGTIVAPLLLTLDEGGFSRYGYDFGLRRSLSNGSLYSLRDAEKYSTFQASEDVDRSVEERARKRAREGDDPDRCARVLLYLPDLFADHGHGSQINTYLMGATTATYQDRAMVLAEPPLGSGKYASGSQFGCPVDAFQENVAGKKANLRGDAGWTVREDFPRGFSRLFDHPAWLSRGCEVPCGDQYSYQNWATMAMRYKAGDFPEITCQNPDGTETNVVVTGSSRLRMHFREHETTMVRDRPSPQAEKWALNLGATPQEAIVFSNIKESSKVWDYVLGLMNKAGFLRLQPWIARDVELFLKTFDLPTDEVYSAIHVRRGDKLAVKARRDIIKYWRAHGHTDPNTSRHITSRRQGGSPNGRERRGSEATVAGDVSNLYHRLIRYLKPQPSGVSAAFQAHVDSSLLTFVPMPKLPGLEVWCPSDGASDGDRSYESSTAARGE
ncbi:hypothetical protein ACHAWF_004536 [Thalassiosira exigua]